MAKDKKSSIKVMGIEISILNQKNEDFISLTDMLEAKDGDFFISDWLRNRNTVEFLGIWERIYNPDFNYGEFATIKSQAGLNNYKISVKDWVAKTNAIGLKATAGRYGGTYAHKDIAFEFGMWISAEFKIYLIKEFQRLKEIESNQYNLEWNVRRVLSKTNYLIQNDAVKNHIIPSFNYSKEMEWLAYASEADLLNVALFRCTAKQWREANPELAKQNRNIRDFSSINELAVLSNLETHNAEMIRTGLNKNERFDKLLAIAKYQLGVLNDSDFMKAIKKTDDDAFLNPPKEQ
jgi:hypothetical protein